MKATEHPEESSGNRPTRDGAAASITSPPAPVGKQAEPSASGYRQILKATSVVGGSSILNVIIGILRSKFTALVLGPTGVGLAGQYLVTVNLFSTLCRCGTDISGARHVAAANGANDPARIGRIFVTLRRLSVVFGLAGMAAMFLFATPLAEWSLGAANRFRELYWIAPAILMGAITGSHVALVQGMRRIGDFARIMVAGNLSGLLVAIPLYLCFGQNGVAPALASGILTNLLVSWYYARKIPYPPTKIAINEMAMESKPILTLGFALMVGALIQSASMFIARALITTEFGIAAIGQFTAAYTLSVVYSNQVLNATGADFLPRLSQVSDDDFQFKRSMNEQSEVVLQLALPGVMGTIAFAPIAVHLFYSGAFNESVGLLRWHLFGVLAWIAHWPLDLAIIALGRAKIYSTLQIGNGLLYAAFVFGGIHQFGLAGVGIAFTALHFLHLLVAFIIVRHIANYTWSKSVTLLFGLAIALTTISFLVSSFFPTLLGYGINFVFLAATGFFCVRSVAGRAGIRSLSQVRTHLQKLRKSH